MNRFFKRVSGIVFFTLVSVAANADDFFLGSPSEIDESSMNCEQSIEGCVGKWEGGVEFGYVAVSGNNDTTSLNGRFALAYEIQKWRHEGVLSTVSSSSESKDTNGNLTKTDSERYNALAKSNYKYSDKAYAFGLIDYDRTKDSGFEYQGSFALGAGYNFIKSDKYILDGELGFGTRKTKTEAILLLPSTTNDESITRIAGLYKWKISKHSDFEQKISSEIGDNNTITKSYTGLSANLIENLAIKLSYSYKRQSDVPVNNAKTETITSFTVVYSF